MYTTMPMSRRSYSSPSYSSYDEGADWNQDQDQDGGMSRVEAGRANYAKESSGLRRYVTARSEAKQQLVAEGVGRKVWDSKRKTNKVVVPRDVLNQRTHELLSAQGWTPKNPTRQSPAARAQRVHHVPSVRELHRPVTRSEAVDLFLQAYKRQQDEGHSPRRKAYPSLAAMDANKFWRNVSPARKSALAGQPVPSPLYRFHHGAQALRSRLVRSPKSRKPELRVCPDSVRNRREAVKEGCQDSWHLRRASSPFRYDVPDVTRFGSVAEAKRSELYRRAEKQIPDSPRSVSPRQLAAREAAKDRLKQYARRKGQNREQWATRVGHPFLPGQNWEQWRARRANERAAKPKRRSPSRSPVA